MAERQQLVIEFIPAPIYQRKGKGFNIKVAKKYIPQRSFEMSINREYNQNPGFLFDYAVLELDTDQNLEEYFGSFGYDFLQTEYQFQQTISNIAIIGYPNNPQSNRKQLVEYNGSVYVDKYYFLYNMPIIKGVAGAPVYVKDDKDYKIIAIHAKDIDRLIRSYRASLRLRCDMLEDIKTNFTESLYQYDGSQQCKSQPGLLKFLKQVDNYKPNPSRSQAIIINLDNNNIENQGCRYLSKTNSNTLRILSLESKKIEAIGCSYFPQAKWNNLQSLNLNDNNIEDEGCSNLSMAKWSNLQVLCIDNNNIRPIGCGYLMQAKWKNLRKLSFDCNNIGPAGCRYLSQSLWVGLQTLGLASNNIGALGCKYLSEANWQNLQTLGLASNNIEVDGCRNLLPAKWQNLQSLYLHFNNIGKEGYTILKNKCRQIYCQWQFQA